MDFDLKEIAYISTTGVRHIHETRLVAASDEALKGYGCLVETSTTFPIEIVRWPAQGWRPVDNDSGRPGRRHRGPVRILVEGRDALRAQHRGRRLVAVRLEHLARGGENRRLGRAARARSRLAGELSPRRWPALLSAEWRELCGAARAPGRRYHARQIHRLLVQPQGRALNPSEYLGRRRHPDRRPCRAPRPPRPRPCPCLGRLCQGVRLLSRRAHAPVSCRIPRHPNGSPSFHPLRLVASAVVKVSLGA